MSKCLGLVLDPVILCVAVRRERLLSALPVNFTDFNSASFFVLLGHGNQGSESRPPIKPCTGNHWLRGELRVARDDLTAMPCSDKLPLNPGPLENRNKALCPHAITIVH